MNALIAETRSGVYGVFALLAFRKDWRRHFNPSSEGVARSFIGVVLALPAYVFLLASANHFVAENPNLVSADAVIGVGGATLSWIRFWALFPIVAAGTALLLGLSGRYAGWLVVHNWTVFLLVHVQALIWALYVAGIADADALLSLVSLYQIARLFVHWRVAAGALDAPMGISAAAAGIPLIVDWMILSVT